MAGPGGSNEIIVKIVSQMKGDSKKVVDEVRKTAAAAGKAEVKEAEDTERKKYKLRESGIKKLRSATDRAAAARRRIHDIEMKDIAAEHKAQVDGISDVMKRKKEAWQYEQRISKDAHKREMAFFDERLRVSSKMRAERIKQQKEDAALAEKTAKENRQKSEKEEREKQKKLDYIYRRSTKERIQHEAQEGRQRASREKYIAARSAREKAHQEVVFAEIEERNRESTLARFGGGGRFRGVYTRSGILVGSKGEALDRSAGEAAANKYLQRKDAEKQVKSIYEDLPDYLKAGLKFIGLGLIGQTVAAGARGVGLVRSARQSSVALRGLERASAVDYSMQNPDLRAAATMGRSPAEYYQARAAAQMGGAGVTGMDMLAFTGTTGLSFGEAASMFDKSTSRGKKVQKDLNQMFGTAVEMGFKTQARQNRFVGAFQDVMMSMHGYVRGGASTPKMLGVARSFSEAGGALGGMFALPAMEQFQAAATGFDPMSSKAAFMRYALGYGRPGSKMSFFQAEAMRRRGLAGDPAMAKKVVSSLREMTGGDVDQMSYMLVNMFGLKQGQAESLLRTGKLEAGKPADKFSREEARARTPPKVRELAERNINLAQSMESLTDSIDSLNETFERLAGRVAPVVEKGVKTYQKLPEAFAPAKKPFEVNKSTPPAPDVTATVESQASAAEMQVNELRRRSQDRNLPPGERQAAAAQVATAKARAANLRTAALAKMAHEAGGTSEQVTDIATKSPDLSSGLSKIADLMKQAGKAMSDLSFGVGGKVQTAPQSKSGSPFTIPPQGN